MASVSVPAPLALSLFLLFLAFSNAATPLSPRPAPNSQEPSRKAPLVGARREIPNVKSNKEVQDLGKFCVDEYNKNHQAHLVFSEVVKAESQVVAGTKYYLKIHAADGGVQKAYDAQVVVKAWLKSKELLSFVPSAP